MSVWCSRCSGSSTRELPDATWSMGGGISTHRSCRCTLPSSWRGSLQRGNDMWGKRTPASRRVMIARSHLFVNADDDSPIERSRTHYRPPCRWRSTLPPTPPPGNAALPIDLAQLSDSQHLAPSFSHQRNRYFFISKRTKRERRKSTWYTGCVGRIFVVLRVKPL